MVFSWSNIENEWCARAGIARQMDATAAVAMILHFIWFSLKGGFPE
jgi:hypothetical protein